MRAIGDRIKRLRESVKLDPKEFAQLAGISQAQQYRIESGERVPDAIYLYKVGALHGASIDALLPKLGRADVDVASTRTEIKVSAPRGYAAGRDMAITNTAKGGRDAKAKGGKP